MKNFFNEWEIIMPLYMVALISFLFFIFGAGTALIFLEYTKHNRRIISDNGTKLINDDIKSSEVIVKETKQSMFAKNYFCPYCGEKLNSLLFLGIAILCGHSRQYRLFGSKETCPRCNNNIRWANITSMFSQQNRVVTGWRKKK